MIKKILLVVAGMVLLGGLLFGRELFSYVGTAYRKAKDSAKANVPIGFEIDRARDLIRDLDPAIRDSMHAIAKEEAGVKQLEKEVAAREGDLAKARDTVLRLKDDVAAGKSEYVYGGRKFTIQQVKTDLASRFANYKTRESTIENLRQILAARKSGLDSARQKLAEMQSARRQLEVEVENLEARLKMVEVAQTTNEFSFDDSQLSRAKQLVSELNSRLDVMAELARAEQTGGTIPVDAPAEEDVVDEVARHFSGATVVKVAEK